MIKYFLKAFKTTNENIILTTPLILFLFIFTIYLDIAKNAPETIPSAALLLITTLFMLSAFFAGWFFMTKKAVELDRQTFIIDEDRAKASLGLIKEFHIGIGEYFLPFLGGIILYSFIFILLCLIAYQAGIHFIGKINLNPAEIKTILNAIESKALISSIPVDKLAKLQMWYALFIIIMTVHYFITMFLVPEIVLRTKNPLIAFFKSVIFIFKNFLSAIILFAYINVLSFIVSLIINGILMLHFIPNFILALISMLVYFYFIVYVIVLVFLYYDNAISTKEENNSDSGTDSIGQEQICDKESEGD